MRKHGKKYNFKFRKHGTGIFIISVLVVFLIICRPINNKMDWNEAYKLKIPAEDLFYLEKICSEYKTDFSEMLCCYIEENNFFKEDENKAGKRIKISDFVMNYANIKVKYTNEDDIRFRKTVKGIYSEIKKFPVPTEGDEEYIYGDSFGAERTYGGKRTHQGCDIMDRENISGRIKVLSMTDGVVEKLGWNEKGGWRVGIRSKNGNYYYYAHLREYSNGLKEGKSVSAGDCLGLMGDSGYGKKEGTTGKFEVHLHVGIETGEGSWINPYPFLRLSEAKEKNN